MITSNSRYDKFKSYLTKDLFKQIIKTFNQELIKEVIEGESVTFPHSLGVFFVKKIVRHHNNRAINWNECIKDAQGKIIKFVYYDDLYYLRYMWSKKGFILNCTQLGVGFLYYYKLKIARGGNHSPLNNVKALINANRKDPFLHLRYQTDKKYKNKIIRLGIIKKEYTIDELKREYGISAFSRVKKAIITDSKAYNHNWELL